MNLLIFPNQLFLDHPGFDTKPSRIVLIEDSLFFGDSVYPASFHKQKLWLHRATMKRFEKRLQDLGFNTVYLEYNHQPHSLKRQLGKIARKRPNCNKIVCCEVDDFILERRLSMACSDLELELEFLSSPQFLNTPQQNQEYRAGKKRWYMADFYKQQRKRLNILLNNDVQPIGGKWSFDDANRKKVPKKLINTIPPLLQIERDTTDGQAVNYVEKCFPANPGSLQTLIYPTTHEEAEQWLSHFLAHKLNQFGPYEDAIVQNESWLWHSVLTPMLNIGLLTPRQVIDATMEHMDAHDVPINSAEGFIRQIIGWREFMRATYSDLGVQMRTTNHWNHTRTIPDSFYNAATGIEPVDDVISRILQTGYCHHIERLMVLGGFMFLCEFDPKEIYRWFMEMFVDSYDWVMVPNVYAMSQNADGGLITTKPYFSGSSYIRKMSHYKSGPWCDVWDGLYWRWIWNHNDQLSKNPRWSMMCAMAKKMDSQKMQCHQANANSYLKNIDEHS